MARRPPLTLRRARARKWAGIDPKPVPADAQSEGEDGDEDLVEFEVVEHCRAVDVSDSCPADEE